MKIREQAKRLLDSYLMALSSLDGQWAASKNGENAKELRVARVRLVKARHQYWLHVQQHACRTR